MKDEQLSDTCHQFCTLFETVYIPEAPEPKILAVPDSFLPRPAGGDIMYDIKYRYYTAGYLYLPSQSNQSRALSVTLKKSATLRVQTGIRLRKGPLAAAHWLYLGTSTDTHTYTIAAMFPSTARRSLASLIPPKIATPNAVVSQVSSRGRESSTRHNFTLPSHKDLYTSTNS